MQPGERHRTGPAAPRGRLDRMAPDESNPNLIVIPAGEAGGEGFGEGDDERSGAESVEQPAKVMRIGSMIKQLLDEVRQAPLDEASRSRLREIYDTSVQELSEGLSEDLRAELGRMTSPFRADEVPSESQLRIAQAQLVGWLEGLFHGIQATLFAQQAAARAQLEEMRRRSLPPGSERQSTPGQYL